MKKILWICNTPLPDIQNLIGVKNYNEGWLVGISNQLRKRDDIEFYYAFPQMKKNRIIRKTINGINFLGFYDNHKNLYRIRKENIKVFKSIIQEINPDIIHIFGTELAHSLECVYSIEEENRNKIVVSIQGLTSEISKVFTCGIPLKYQLIGRFDDYKYCCILRDKYEFYRSGINERKLLQSVANIIGRTDWDRKCVMSINQKCYYYHCNETLRDVFYDGTWDIQKIQRYSIFISQAFYPIKGLHVLIYALPYIKKCYPNVAVYVGGKKEFLENNSPYGVYVKKLIRKMKLENNVRFLGYLTSAKVKQWLLKSHVMIMPSIIENSPNSVGEAMLLGTPVVAANVGGVSSILNNGRDGYLYASMNKIELAKSVCKVFSDDKAALRISRNGKMTAKSLYSKEDNIKQLMLIYDEIINR